MFLEGVPRPKTKMWVADHSDPANMKKIGLKPLQELTALTEELKARIEALEEEVRKLKGG